MDCLKHYCASIVLAERLEGTFAVQGFVRLWAQVYVVLVRLLQTDTNVDIVYEQGMGCLQHYCASIMLAKRLEGTFAVPGFVRPLAQVYVVFVRLL